MWRGPPVAQASHRDTRGNPGVAAGSLRSASALSVSIYPGAIALTVMPSGASSFCHRLRQAAVPCLEAYEAGREYLPGKTAWTRR